MPLSKRGKPTGAESKLFLRTFLRPSCSLLAIVCLLISLGMLATGCSDAGHSAGTPAAAADEAMLPLEPSLDQEGEVSFELTSAAFADQGAIPEKYSCDGDDISPQLAWSEPPAGTASYALIFDDPDAIEDVGYTWVHWVLYNLPAAVRALPEAISASDLPGSTLSGRNSWDRMAYGGPCPPKGTHRYYFKLYALDDVLDLEAGATSEELLSALQGHILDEATLVGSYTR